MHEVMCKQMEKRIRNQRREGRRVMRFVWACCVSVCFSILLLLTACSSIDEDLSDCGYDYEMVYELQLVTNISTELQTQLTTETERQVGEALGNHLSEVFKDHAQDIHLSFYDVDETGEVLYQREEQMNNSEKSYTIYLPMRQYRHLALANLQENTWVHLENDENSQTSALVQKEGDVVESHETGIFTARSDMDVLENVDQTFLVKLFMANSAEALVIDPRGQEFKSIQVYATGFATGFNVNDSIYTFAEKSPMVHTQEVQTGTDMLCFCGVNFPSRDKPDGDEPLWEFRVYVTKMDGTVTETVLGIRDPLKAGELKIVKAYLDADGSVCPTDATVGVNITLDWNSGGDYDTPL